jgi:hypothetical protein
VADRFFVLNPMASWEVECPGFALDRARALTVGTGVLGSEGLCLLFQEGVEGSLDQSAADLEGHFLQDAEADVEPGSLRPEGASGHDFSPLSGEFADFADIFQAWLDARHGLPSLALTS